jgi:large repetitive protein
LLSNSIVNDTWENLTSAALDVVYTFVPVGNNGCAGDEFTVTVTVESEPVVADQSLTICSDQPLEANFNSSSTVAAATYNITNLQLNGLTVSAGNAAVSNGLTAADLADDAFTNPTNGAIDVVYTVVPVTAGGCEGDAFTITITVNPEPVIADKIAALICSGETFKVEPMQGVDGDNIPVGTTYIWTVVDNPNVAGESDEILIPQPEISQTLVNTTNNIEEVIYTVIPVTSDGCQGESFIISVTVNPEIQDNATVTNVLCSYSNPICAGSIEVNPTGIGPFTFYWSSNNGNLSRPENQNQFNLCPGDYSLEITDSSGCTQSFNYTITPPEPIEVNLISLVDMSCNNIGLNCDGYIELDIQGGTSPYILKEFYTESNPGSGQFDLLVETNSNILNNACEGNYVFKVLDTNGCEFVSSIYTIKEISFPITVTENISNYNGYEISCLGANDGFMDISVSGGSGSFTYNLSPGGILDSDLNTQNVLEFRNLKAGTYTLTITDDNCPNNITLEYDLKEPSQLTSLSSLVSGPALCFGDTVTYNVSASGGTAPYTGTGNYTLTVGVHSIKITDANGCETIETITVTEPDELKATAIVTNPILCNGEMGEVTVNASGGVPPYKGTGIFSVKSGDFIFTVTDANDCTYSNNIFINEPAELSFTIDSIENPTCSPDWSYSNGSICITISGGTNPFPIGNGWTSLGGGVWCLNGLSAGTHKIDVDDLNNCSTNTDSKVVVLTRPSIIDAQISSIVKEDCDNNAMIQTNYIFVTGGSPPYEISWSGGNVCNPLNPQCMETTESGTYIAYIHDQESLTNGCPPIEVGVIVDLPIIGDAAFSYSSANNSFCDLISNNEVITFNNESTGDVVNFYWDFGDGTPVLVGDMNPTHLYTTAGSYEVSLTVEYPSECCTETYTERIEITKGYQLVLPNAFTPNQDGINDTIRPLYSCMQNVQMFIYDTWGTLVYFEEGISLAGWDGSIRNTPAENGNYLMIVKALTFNGNKITESKSITLIK